MEYSVHSNKDVEARAGSLSKQEHESEKSLNLSVTDTDELPPIDSGAGAWTYLICALVVEAFAWGFPLSWGVFQDFYSNDTHIQVKGLLPIVGIFSTALTYISAPILVPLTTLYPRARKIFMVAGLGCCIFGSIGAAFATTVWQLVLSQGVLYGFGVAGLYCPTLPMLFEWFDKRRGLASGIMFGGTGLSGLGLPFLFSYLLDSHGAKTTLLIWTGILVVFIPPAIYLIQGRVVGKVQEKPSPRNVVNLFRSHRFWVLTTSNIFQGVAYLVPLIHLPSYGRVLSLSNIECTVLASLLNLSAVIGQVLLGQLSDVMDVHYLVVLAAAISSTSVFLLWGFATGFASLTAFAVLFGMAAGGFSSLWTRFTKRCIPKVVWVD